MHVPDGWVDLPTSAGAAVIAAAAVAVAGRRMAARLKERATAPPAVLAAYLLVAQVPAVPLGVGTSAHLIGTGLATALVGPAIAIVCVATVVVVQALVLADGGVTAIGINLLANGPVPALVAAGVLASWRRWSGRRSGGALNRLPAAAGVAAALGTVAAAATTATILAVGGTDVIPAGTVAAVVGGSHLVVAAGEGLITAAVVGVVARLRPDLLPHPGTERPAALVETSARSDPA